MVESLIKGLILVTPFAVPAAAGSAHVAVAKVCVADESANPGRNGAPQARSCLA